MQRRLNRNEEFPPQHKYKLLSGHQQEKDKSHRVNQKIELISSKINLTVTVEMGTDKESESFTLRLLKSHVILNEKTFSDQVMNAPQRSYNI